MEPCCYRWRIRMKDPVYEIMKRLMDVCLSAAGLIVLSPVMLLTAVLIKAQDGGTVLYRQKRLTRNGKIFEIYKFRSMKMDAEKDGKARLAKNPMTGLRR